MSGLIDGLEWAAACTCGDGACGFHALLGMPSEHGGALRCGNVRQIVMEHLPETFAAASSALLPGARELLVELLDDVWRLLELTLDKFEYTHMTQFAV